MPTDAQTQDSFSKSFFAGEIREEMVFPFPEAKTEEKEMLRILLDTLKKFSEENIHTAKIDQEGEIPENVMKGLAEMGLFGLQVPENYGGVAMGQMSYGRVCEELAAIDASVAVTLGAHQSIGMKGLLLFGSEEQKGEFLPKLASGQMLAAFALTEPGSGSDAYSIKSRAVRQSDGTYILNGNKIWITNGGIADFFTIFAKTEVDTAEGKKDKVTAFIVTRNMPGFSSGKGEKKMGIRGSSTTEISFSDVRIPAEYVLGEVGKGFKIAMEILNSGRLGLATGCVGGSKKCLSLAARHATERKQFGQSISEFGLIKEKLGRMTMDTYVLESMAYLTCGMVDRGVADYSMESAMSKIVGSETSWRVANEATQIAGGSSYMQEYPYEQMLRDTRINMIFEGTNEILRLFVALTGMRGVGENLKLVGDALNAPIKSLGVLYDYFVSQKISRSLYGDRITKAHPELKREASMVEDHVQELVGAVEKVIRKYRKKIWEKQFVQKRIAEISIDLYGMIAVLSRATQALEKGGVKGAEVDLTVARTFCSEATRRISRNFRAMDRNVDELLKSLSAASCTASGYPLELLP